MAGNTGKVVIDADASKAVAAAKKTGDAFKDATKQAAGLGGQIDGFASKFAKTLVGVGAVTRAIAAAAQEVVNLQRAAADASRKTGGNALDSATAGARLGLTGRESAAFTAASGGRSREDMIGLLNALADAEGPGRVKVTKTNAFQAREAFSRSTVTSQEAVEAAQKGLGKELIGTADKRFALIGDDAQGELAIRQKENAAAEQAAQINAARNGGRNRLAQSQRALRNARDPITGAFQNTVAGFTSAVGGDSVIEAADIMLIGNKLDAQTAIMRSQSDRPALAPSPDKQ